ncbi:fructosamine kinase family protein [Marinobacterium jannaschii]|uniref:fructosamine kinase family protein n=1 Tax=Marinobacterium jannaschii TaxID=64970 RepID=UPI00068411B5|nr:fructosamine kinase family protein [Marinobacterium jannaschii]
MITFSKCNPLPGSDSLSCEAAGLELLRSVLCQSGNNLLRVPQLISQSPDQLQLQAISRCAASARQMARLGRGLALLHRLPQARYGLAQDNYIGLNPQPNGLSDNWGEFFVTRRLEYQLGLIADAALRQGFSARLAACKVTLTGYLNRYCEQPSLLHGDLWSGNVLFDSEDVWLIDPAVYCGDREADIAMTELFGGFSAVFYAAYDAEYPRSEVYPAKRTIYNLYHYLNHYNLFGSGYLAACQRGFEQLPGLIDHAG